MIALQLHNNPIIYVIAFIHYLHITYKHNNHLS